MKWKSNIMRNNDFKKGKTKKHDFEDRFSN